MTPAEAAEVVDRLIAPYPGPPWPQQTLDAWTDAVARSSAGFQPSLGVADRWAEANDRTPSLHQFLAAIAPPPPPAAYVAGHDPDQWRPDPAVARRLAHTWRAALAATKAGHYHHGPNPCPVCGGQRPRKVYAPPPTTPTPHEGATA